MYKNLELLNKENHKNKSIAEVKDYSYAKGITSAIVTFSEFFEVCKNYPIFFGKDKDGSWFASAIMGYKENENVFIDKDGKWEKFHYVPAFIRRYPFVFVTEDNKNLAVAVDKEFLSEDKKDESRKLFDDKGEKSKYLEAVVNFLNQFYTDSVGTKNFIEQLEKWELLEEKTATITTPKNEKFNINGFYIINEEKLKNASKEIKQEIFEKNATPLITAHLISLSNLQKIGANS